MNENGGTFATKTVSGTVGKPLYIDKPLLQPNNHTEWMYIEQVSETADGNVNGETTGEAGEETGEETGEKVAGTVSSTGSGWEYIVPEGSGEITLKFGLGAS